MVEVRPTVQQMNLIDAMRLYCHIMQRERGGLAARKLAKETLMEKGVSLSLCEKIADAVSNDGHIVSGNGNLFAITQISSS